MRFDYVIADLNALVTPMALHTKAKFMTIATRHCWAVRCCSSSPISAMPSGLWGTPTLAVLHFLDCALYAISSAWDLLSLTVTWLRPTSPSLLSWHGTYPGKSSQISQFNLDDPTSIIISPQALHFFFLTLTAMYNYV